MKNCSFDLVSFVNVRQFVCVLLSLWFWECDVGFDCIGSGHSLFFTLLRSSDRLIDLASTAYIRPSSRDSENEQR